MHSNRFTELFNRYLDNTATEEEQRALMTLIRQGQYDETIKEKIDDLLNEQPGFESLPPDQSRRILEQIFNTEPTRIVPMGRSRSWRWAAAASVILVCGVIGWWRWDTTPRMEQAMVQQEAVSRPAIFSGKQFVRLPDGSTVLLNEGSQLSYAPSFGASDREVILSGEGYFDVQHDPSRPFRVLTGKITTTVLGTAFNIKAYPDQEEVKVTVTRGKVQVEDDKGTLGILTPDHQIAVKTGTLDFVQRAVDADAEVAWQNRYLILDNVSLEEAVRIIGERYDVRIALANEQLKSCSISATFLNGENLDQVLTVVAAVVRANYVMQPDSSIRIEGPGCAD